MLLILLNILNNNFSWRFFSATFSIYYYSWYIVINVVWQINFFLQVAEQWKLLGEEKNGTLMVGWTEETEKQEYTVIGRYDRIKDTLHVKAFSLYNIHRDNTI